MSWDRMMLHWMKPFFGTDLFIPHGHCYLWKPELVGLHILSDALIALAYYSIPLTLFYFVRRRQDLPFTWVFLLFSAFIVACGTTHWMEIWTLWHPTYWLSGVLKLITAVVSLTTAVLLVPLVPKALALPSPAQLEAANQALQCEMAERQQMNLALQASEARLAGILEIAEDAIISIATNQRITLFNQGAERIFGYTAAEAIGQPLDLLLPNHLASSHRQHVADFSQTPTISRKMGNRREIFGRRKDGTEFPAEASISKLQLGNEVVFTAFLRDVTERKRIEDERKQAELAVSRLAAIVESSGDAIIGKSLDGMITSWNASAERLFGYTAAEVIDRPISLLFTPDHADELAQVLGRIKHGETVESYETVRVRKDGRHIDIAATISPIKDATGRVIGAAKIARNITARKQAEAALRESENRFQVFMNNSPAASWITDADGRMLYLSQTYSRLFQIPNNAIGKTIFDLFAPEIAEDFHCNIRQVVETNQTVKAIEVAPRPDGTLGEFLVYKFPICELSGQCVVGGVAVDVSEREQAKRQLRSLNDRLQYLLIHAPVVIFSCKVEGDYGATSMSENVRTLFGYEPQEFLADSDFWANHIHSEDRDRILANLSQIFTTGHHAHEYRFLHGDGEYRWVYNQLQLMRDAAGQPTEIIGYLVDISERQAALHEREQAEATIQQSEARYRAIVEDQAEFIVRFQSDGILTFVNDAYCRYFGMARENLVGHRYEPVVFAEDLEQVDQVVRSMNRENPTVVIENRILVGGAVRWTQWVNRMLFDDQGDLSEIQAVGRDIHDLKQAEEALRQSEAKNRAMLAAIPDLLLRVKQDGTCLDFIPPVALEAGTFMPIEQHLSEILPPDLLQHQLQRIEKSLATGELQVWEHQLIMKGSKLCDEELRLIPCGVDEVLVIVRDISEQQAALRDRKQAEDFIKASLKEKEVLLKEIHHRVKNNLGVVDGLLQMQSRRSQNSEVIETLKESQNRIASIALVHEKLYNSDDLANIDFAQYIADLTAHLFASYNIHANQIKLTTQIDAIALDIDTAIPCGLIINELVSNALKYAFPNTRMGEIQVTLQQQRDQSLSLIVRDNGIGLSQDFNLKQPKTLGMNLVKGLVQQLRGTLEISSELGTTAVITFARGK